MTPQPLKWLRMHHSHNNRSIFHVNKPFEVWLEDILNNSQAVGFRILPNESHSLGTDVEVVMLHVPENVEVRK